MIDYHVDSLRRVVTTRVTGHISLADFSAHLLRILRDPKFQPDFNALVVATDAASIPSAASAELLKPLVKAWSFKRAGAKWAFVLPSAEARVFTESVLLELKLTSVTTRCFLSEAAALGWLEAGAAAEPAPPALSRIVPPLPHPPQR